MPQMKPLNWLFLYIMSISLLLLMMMFNYFNFKYENMVKKSINSINLNLKNWKW
uniref:ATP synthase complex subunit 8 n=1 Tax=Cecidomyiidae sp. 3 LC-2017 TaxID=2030135 RepID=A0A343LA44_9DIPT|nr:ATP synthase F0 subunit 8 [Cecidomyiidae sp. 3 LC-2017]